MYPLFTPSRFINQDDMSVPLFTDDWCAEDELLLLEGIEMFGLGNWSEVADHIGSKDKEQCEAHYFSAYIDVETCPLPVALSS